MYMYMSVHSVPYTRFLMNDKGYTKYVLKYMYIQGVLEVYGTFYVRLSTYG